MLDWYIHVCMSSIHITKNSINEPTYLLHQYLHGVRPKPHESQRKFHNCLQHGTFAFEKSSFPCFSPYTMEFQALVTGSIEVHLLCHVTLLYCQVHPNPKPQAKSKAKKSLLPLPILPLMWQPPAHLNQCYLSNSLPFMQVSSRVVSA